MNVRGRKREDMTKNNHTFRQSECDIEGNEKKIASDVIKMKK
jgi:hypothetical protein